MNLLNQIRAILYDPAFPYLEGWVEDGEKMRMLCRSSAQEITQQLYNNYRLRQEITSLFEPELNELGIYDNFIDALYLGEHRTFTQLLLYLVDMQNDIAIMAMDDIITKQIPEILTKKVMKKARYIISSLLYCIIIVLNFFPATYRYLKYHGDSWKWFRKNASVWRYLITCHFLRLRLFLVEQ